MGIVIKWAELSKGYYYGEFLQHKPGLGCEITGDTTEDEALDMLEKLLDRWHTKKTSGTPFESLKPEAIMSNGIVQTPQYRPVIIDYGKHDASTEGVLADIEKCQTLEELKSYKLLAAGDKTTYSAYCKRLKELSI
jgi:hypothetical protein